MFLRKKSSRSLLLTIGLSVGLSSVVSSNDEELWGDWLEDDLFDESNLQDHDEIELYNFDDLHARSTKTHTSDLKAPVKDLMVVEWLHHLWQLESAQWEGVDQMSGEQLQSYKLWLERKSVEINVSQTLIAPAKFDEAKFENDDIQNSHNNRPSPQIEVNLANTDFDQIDMEDEFDDIRFPTPNFKEERLDHEEDRLDHEDDRIDHEENRLDHEEERLDHEEDRIDHEEERLDREEDRIDHEEGRIDREDDRIDDRGEG